MGTHLCTHFPFTRTVLADCEGGNWKLSGKGFPTSSSGSFFHSRKSGNMARAKIEVTGKQVAVLAKLSATNTEIADVFACNEGTI